MNKVSYLFIAALLFFGILPGCQGPVEGALDESSVATAIAPTVDMSASPTVAVTPSSTLSVTVASTSTPVPLPTPTPFLCHYLHGHTELGELNSEAMGEEVRFTVHLPPCYDAYPTRAFPVLYLLHGWPLDERHWDSLGVDELADDWINRGMVGPFIIVMPGVGRDGRYVNSSGGPWSFEGMLVDELLPLVDATYRTWRDPSGRAIGGISRGGVWALEIALRHQGLFGIVGAHSPALALNRPMPQYDPFLLVKDIEGDIGLRFYLDAGDGDWARSATVQLRDVLLEQDIDVTYQVHEGGHVDALWQGALADYLEFYTVTWPRSFDDLPLWYPDLE